MVVDDDYDDCDWVDTLPSLITDNDVKICLEPNNYTNSLTVNGNGFELIGEAGGECYDDDWTTISGKVTINGNNATLKNIKFTGAKDENGNNISFINCCY